MQEEIKRIVTEKQYLKNAFMKRIEIQDKYIEELEHIRNCYFKQIENQIEEKKIFKRNNKDRKYTNWEVEQEINKHIPNLY